MKRYAALVLLSTLVLTACSKGEEQSIKIAPPPQAEVKDNEQVEDLLKSVLTVPRGTKAFTEWHDLVKSTLTDQLYQELGVEYFFNQRLPYQANFDNNPKYYNTNFDNNPIGYGVTTLVVEQTTGNAFNVSAMIGLEVGEDTAEETHTPYTIQVELADGKISKLDGSPFDTFKLLKPLTVADYERQTGDNITDMEEVGATEADKQALKIRLEQAVAALDSTDYYTDFITQKYLAEFFGGQEKGVQAFASSLKNHGGYLAYDTLKVASYDNAAGSGNRWVAYILNKEDDGVVAQVRGNYRNDGGKITLGIDFIDIVRR